MSQYWKMWNLSSKVDQSYEEVVRTSRCRAGESLADLTLQVQLWNTKWQQASGLHFYSLWYTPSGDQNYNLLEPARTTADTPLLDHWHDDSLMSNCHCVLALSICLPACRPQLVWIPPHILRGAADVRVSLTAVNQCNRRGPLPLPLPYTHTETAPYTLRTFAWEAEHLPVSSPSVIGCFLWTAVAPLWIIKREHLFV